ncbi:MAG TPA: glutaredoxin family protein [Candidatus Atribacteria bacterium]|nr:glutaredoxin family protein [Candidatus Atribacteria bacterium]HPZ81288.1 glutaredoxin family protein [Candidatus Atribacteria bacterium]HQE25065.1 glutaredoxin family protein [Candidatus Atribacteria bacterium]
MKEVMLYTLSTCPFCKMAKEYFENHHIPYRFVDVDLLEPEEREKTVAKVQEISGRRAFPVIVIGNQVIVGYDEVGIGEALQE